MHTEPSSFLCATDFSESAKHAANVAAHFALVRSLRLLLVHVEPSGKARLRGAARNHLEIEANRLRSLGPNVDVVLLRGRDRSQALLDFIGDQNVAMVLMGGSTHMAPDRWAPGRFPDSFAQQSPVPTLVVREPFSLFAWNNSSTPLRVLAAIDCKGGSAGVLRAIKHLSHVGAVDIIACHIRCGPEDTDAEDDASVETRLRRDMGKLLRDEIGSDVAQYVIRRIEGSVENSLLAAAKEAQAQLIVLGSHQRRGVQLLLHGSVSRGLLRTAGPNVLCVPGLAQFDPRDAHVPTLNRVLVATDFSDLGNAAVPFAFSLCRPGGHVRIMHVSPADADFDLGPARRVREALRELIPSETEGRFGNVGVYAVAHNSPVEAICREAAAFGADVVCLASHGVGASRAFHGSVAKGVLNSLHRPVFILRRPEM